MKPTYPVYIISKGRHDVCMTANFMLKDKLDFRIVVEPQERDAYADKYGNDRLLVLPFSNLGLGSIPARNWVKQHATDSGAIRHWIFDDNIRFIKRRWKSQRIRCNSNAALKACEDFVDRYENVAIAGLQYTMFAPNTQRMTPIYLNTRVFSCLLILNSIPHKWRGRYNEDTDLSLQVLSDGWCTVLFNAFLIDKMPTMTMKGGNATELYKGDGRLKMARSLERVCPYVVDTRRRYNRPQHHVSFKKFDTELVLKPGLKLDIGTNDYGLKMMQVGPEAPKSALLREMLSEFDETPST